MDKAQTKPSSKDLIDALERIYGMRYSILREVTIVDPEESEMYAAYYYRTYPEYYAKTMEMRKISQEDLPEIPDDYFPGKNPVVRRIDALMLGSMDAYGEYPATAVEVKVSRADFRRDTEAKRKAWFKVTNRFVYLVPKDLIKPEETPEGCGLWYWEQGRITIAKKAKIRHHVDPFPVSFNSYLIGRAARAESELRHIKKRSQYSNPSILDRH